MNKKKAISIITKAARLYHENLEDLFTWYDDIMSNYEAAFWVHYRILCRAIEVWITPLLFPVRLHRKTDTEIVMNNKDRRDWYG